MLRRPILILAGLMLLATLWLVPTSPAPATDYMIYYYYPYQYFSHNYWPNYVRWPDPRIPFQAAPPYMAYPQVRDELYHYSILQNRRYYRGFHFFLDQF